MNLCLHVEKLISVIKWAITLFYNVYFTITDYLIMDIYRTNIINHKKHFKKTCSDKSNRVHLCQACTDYDYGLT